jgi:phosphoglycerate dehydrogenase-like enzyme
MASVTVLVPAAVAEELTPLVAAVSPDIRAIAYREDDTDVPGAEEAVAVYRWIAGKRFEGFARDSPRMRWIQTASAGIDHVVTPTLRELFRQRHDLLFTDSGPAFGICMGEFVLAMMLAVAHRLPDHWEQRRKREWEWLTHEELYGATVGIVGLGPVGVGIAQRCKAMGMRTLGLRRRPEPVPDVDAVYTGPDGLTTLLQESDWLVIAAASTLETRHLIGAAELARMKPTARLINVARGALVDESALIAALQSGRIAAACLDVFATEPLPQDSPLWTLPNAHTTPHNATGWTRAMRRRQFDLFTANLRRFLNGEPLEGLVDVDRGY